MSTYSPQAVPREVTEALDTVAAILREQSIHRPLSALAVMARMEKIVGDLTPTAGAAAREDGQTWSTIGHALGTTRQAAYQRFSRFLDPELVSGSQD